MKGSYILLLHLPEAQSIAVGRLGNLHFPQGHYAYVGSAMGGFRARVNHHLKPAEKHHWHIDYLRDRAYVSGITLCPTEQRTECAIVQGLGQHLDCISGFGASDCRCRSHLFFTANECQMKETITETMKRLRLITEYFFPPSEASDRINRL
ncbi:DUF123 domain-containing protein [Bacteroidota bacterium]